VVIQKLAIIGDGHIRLPKNKDSVEYIEDVRRYDMLHETLVNGNYDSIVFVGDLFDKARPSLEEIQFVTEFVKDLPNVIIIDGNHEAVTKNTSTYDYIQIPNTTYMPLDRFTIGNTSIQTLGYKHLEDYKYVNKADILLTHFRSNAGIIKEEIPTIELAKKYKDIILGDIHMMYNPLPNVWYTSSPYGLHYQAKKEQYGYIELHVTNDSGYTIKRVELDLPKKIKAQMDIAEYLDLVNRDITDRYVIEVEGNLQELKSIIIHPLVKVIPKLKDLGAVTSPSVSKESLDILKVLKSSINVEGRNTDILDKIYKEVV